MSKGTIKYTDLFASDVHIGLLELEDDAKRLNQTFAELAKIIVNSKTRINISIKEQKTTINETKNALENFDVATKNAGDSLLKFSKQSEESSKRIKNLEDHQKSLNNIFDLSTASVDEIKAKVKELTAEYNALGRATDADKIKMQALSSEVVKLKTEQDNLTKVLNKGKVAIEAAEGSYQQASDELARLRKELREMPGAIDKTSNEWNKANPEVKKYIDQIQKLDSSLKKFDADMGNHQRNVGNYKSGWNGLGNSINQITRELPAFANSMQTGFMAISNNIPAVFDEIRNTKTEIAAMRAEGQKVPGLFSKLTSSIFSWGTALSLGVTLLTLYGPKLIEWVSTLFKGKEAVDQLRNSQEYLNNAFESSNYVEATKNVTELSNNIELAKRGFIDKSDVIEQYNNTLGKTMGTVKTFNEVERKMIESVPAYLEMMRLKAAAQLALDAAAKKSYEAEQQRAKSAQEGNGWFYSGLQNSEGGKKLANKVKDNRVKAADEAAQAELNIYKKLQNDAAKLAKDNKFELFGDENNNKEKAKKAAEGFEIIRQKIQNVSLEIEKGLLDGSIDKTDIALSERFKALESELKKLIDLQNQLLNPMPDFTTNRGMLGNPDENIVISDPEKESKNEVAILQKKILEIERRYSNHNKNLLTLYQSGTISREEFEQRAFEFKKSKQEEIYFTEQNILTQSYNRELDLIQKRLKSVKQGSDKYLKLKEEESKIEGELSLKRAKLEEENEERKTEDFIKAQKLRVDEMKKTTDQLRESLSSISEYLGDGITDAFNVLFDALDKFAEKGEWSAISFAEKFQVAAQSSIAAMQSFTDFSIQASQNRISNLEKEKENDLAIAGDNADAKRAIEERYSQKVKLEKQKQAKAEKQAALFSIALNTAMAVASVLSTGGGTRYADFGISAAILSGIVIASGAAQAALVLSKPIPEFYKGTNYSPEGPAKIAERGAEIIQDPTGKKTLVTQKSIVNLKKGSKVFTADQTTKFLDKIHLDHNIDVNRSLTEKFLSDKRNHDIEAMAMALNMAKINEKAIGKEVSDRIAELPLNNWSVDEKGFTRRIRKGNTTITNLNERNSL